MIEPEKPFFFEMINLLNCSPTSIGFNFDLFEVLLKHCQVYSQERTASAGDELLNYRVSHKCKHNTLLSIAKSEWCFHNRFISSFGHAVLSIVAEWTMQAGVPNGQAGPFEWNPEFDGSIRMMFNLYTKKRGLHNLWADLCHHGDAPSAVRRSF